VGYAPPIRGRRTSGVPGLAGREPDRVRAVAAGRRAPHRSRRSPAPRARSMMRRMDSPFACAYASRSSAVASSNPHAHL